MSNCEKTEVYNFVHILLQWILTYPNLTPKSDCFLEYFVISVRSITVNIHLSECSSVKKIQWLSEQIHLSEHFWLTSGTKVFEPTVYYNTDHSNFSSNNGHLVLPHIRDLFKNLSSTDH